MKSLPFLFLLPVLLSSCCCGNRKCTSSPYPQRMRIVNAVTGDDLLFGPSRIYDKEMIKFYSLEGNDTIVHYHTAGASPSASGDSLLYVSFIEKRKETVYIRLSPTDRDTLSVQYYLEKSGNCCPDYYMITGMTQNGAALQQNGGVYSIKK